MIVLKLCLYTTPEKKPFRPQGSVDACASQRHAGTTQLQLDLLHNQNFRGTTRSFAKASTLLFDTQIEA
jgi:hypothetical protein